MNFLLVMLSSAGLLLVSSLIVFYVFGYDYEVLRFALIRTRHYEFPSISKRRSRLGIILEAIGLLILSKVRWIWIRIETWVSPQFIKIFEKRNIEFLFYKRWGEQNKRSQKENVKEYFFSKMASEIKKGKSIKIRLGEMGHLLIDNEKIIDAFLTAYKRNQAEIEIVHGPRVDPRTAKIYELVESGIVDTFKSNKYFQNHYMVIETASGNKTVFDEGIHDETLWRLDSDDPLLESLTRNIYIIKGDKKIFQSYIDGFEYMKNNAKRSTKNPKIENPQNFSWLKLFIGGIINNLILGRIIQPISIAYDIPMKILFFRST